ncbi:MAG TPA: four helix bundle protein [Thermoanaerobaculia bacterium]|jgi:four helix bundle protein|nr:four helix bundle protein [Thermoanaerobaculia bacterium]
MSDSYRDIVAWQRAMALVSEIYKCTETFPRREIYGLTNQIRRAAVSVPSNIAEGKGRRSKKEYVQFLYRARGSLHELETQLEIALNLGYLPAGLFGQVREAASAVARPLNGLITSVEDQLHPDSREPTADSPEN